MHAAINKPPAAAVVWFHGFGDEPESWSSEFRSLRGVFPTVQWVHLRAPRRAQSCYGGERVFSWGDFLKDEIIRPGSQDYDNDAVVHNETRTEALAVLDSLEVPKIIIGGFSMGAAAAADAAVHFVQGRSHRRNVFLIMLNGWLPPSSREALVASRGALKGVLVSHGKHDEQVHVDCGTQTARWMREAAIEVEVRMDTAASHAESGFGPGAAAAAKFIEQAVTNRPSNRTGTTLAGAEDWGSTRKRRKDLV